MVESASSGGFPSPWASGGQSAPASGLTAEVGPPAAVARRQRLGLLMASYGALMLLLALVSSVVGWRTPSRGHDPRQGLSRGLRPFLLGCSAISGLGLLVALVTVYRFAGEPQGDIQAAINLPDRDADGLAQLPLLTGIYLESMAIREPRSIELSGYIWQRYRDGVHDDVSRGFVLPDSRSMKILRTSSRRQGDAELLTWRFSAVVPLQFDDRRFPLGRERVRLRIWPRESSVGVILVPDRESFPANRSSRRPGLDPALTIPGWKVASSSLEDCRLDAAVPSEGPPGAVISDVPELCFDLVLRSELVGPVVFYVLPLALCMILLYCLLLVSGREELELQAFQVVKIGVGLLLMLLLLQADLRSSLPFRGASFLDLFYGLGYLMLLTVVVNVLLLSQPRWKLFPACDRVLPRALFWPVLLTFCLVITLTSQY